MNERQIKKHYYSLSEPGSLSGKGNFLRALKSQNIQHNPKHVETWLQKEEPYSLHRPVRKKFLRNRVFVPAIDDTWQIDLVDMQKYSRVNKGFRYILTCIDVFSKYSWAVPVLKKTSTDVTLAFKKILDESGRCPKKMQFDEGKEFLNKEFKNLLKNNQIKFYHVSSVVKACVVERFNRTLKEKMWRYFTFTGKYVYIDVLQKLIKSYNSSYHRTIRMAPENVNKSIEKELWKRVYLYNDYYDNGAKLKFKLKVGDKVRISKHKKTFEKGYTPNWSQEVFIITERIPRNPPVYKIKDQLDETISGIFYEKELQKISNEEITYKIEKVLRSRTRNNKKEILVSWLGYPDKFNSWIDANTVVPTSEI